MRFSLVVHQNTYGGVPKFCFSVRWHSRPAPCESLNTNIRCINRTESCPQVEPNWRLEDVFVHEVHQEALEYDQKPTHPISGSVNTSAQIGAMFDDISYSKAGAVLRMLMYTVTEANFRQALNVYLTNNE